MTPKLNSTIAVIGIDIGKNSFHVVGHDQRGAIALRQKWSRGQVTAFPIELATTPAEARAGAAMARPHRVAASFSPTTFSY